VTLRAVIFDVDGVLTSTGELHLRAWIALFDEFFSDKPVSPFTTSDYYQLVDGRPRQDGLAAVLDDRKLHSAMSDVRTVKGLTDRKQDLFESLLATEGVVAFPDVEPCLARLRRGGLRIGAASASKNARRVLAAASLSSELEVILDGIDAANLGLAGKPSPDLFDETARSLGLRPDDCVVVEDAAAGVHAASSGGFGVVVGLNRSGRERPDLERWADLMLVTLEQLSGTLLHSVQARKRGYTSS
jgi:beta-phosphoglucomutase family hydrolase